MASDFEFRRRVLAGEPVVGTFLNLGSPSAAEVAARTGVDWLLLDLEHGMGTEADIVPTIWAARSAGTPVVVRPEQGTRLRIGRALDLGADGVMIPQVSGPEEAREIASWLRFQPAGKRGIALFTRGLDFGSGGHASPKPRNEEILGIAQVETALAADQAHETAAIDGIDVLFVGPTDLSHALGAPRARSTTPTSNRPSARSRTPPRRTARPQACSCGSPRTARATPSSVSRCSRSVPRARSWTGPCERRSARRARRSPASQPPSPGRQASLALISSM